MGRKLDREVGKLEGTPEPMVVISTLKDKPSLLCLANFSLGDISDLHKWLVAFAAELHNTGLKDQRSRKLADRCV